MRRGRAGTSAPQGRRRGCVGALRRRSCQSGIWGAMAALLGLGLGPVATPRQKRRPRVPPYWQLLAHREAAVSSPARAPEQPWERGQALRAAKAPALPP